MYNDFYYINSLILKNKQNYKRKYKNILIGNQISDEWLTAIKNINKSNIKIIKFTKHIKKYITHIHYILPLSINEYNVICNLKINKIILHPKIEIFNMLNNKLTFTQFMLTNFNTYIPKVYYLNNNKLCDLEFPVISKPIYSSNGRDMKIYYNETEFIECIDKIIIQKFIDDEYEYGAYLLCLDGNIINWKVIRHKYQKYTIKTDNFPNTYENISNFNITIFSKIINMLKYSGGINIDFKYDITNNIINIFEINPRFGGSAFTNNFIYELLCIK